MAGILVKLDSCSIRLLSAIVIIFYAFLLHEKVMFFLVSIFIRMSLSTLTRQFYWTNLFSKNVFYEGLNSPILKYRSHRISYPNSKKKVFTVRLKSFDWDGGGAEILLETNLGLGEAIHNLYSEDQNKKQQEQISRSEELNFFRKKGEEPKKMKRSLRSRVKVNTNQEKEIDERIAVLVTKLSMLALRLWGGAALQEKIQLCCLYTKFLNKIFINMYSNNTLLNADKDL